MEQKRAYIAKARLSKQQTWRHHITPLQTIPQGYKNRNVDQGNRIENPEIKPDTHSQLIFSKANKNIVWKGQPTHTHTHTHVLKNLNMELSHDPAIPLLDIDPK